MPRFVFVLALAATLAVGGASAAHRAVADTSPSVYTDPAGDAGTAPDITGVTLTPGAGTVLVDVTFSGALGSDGDLLFLVDADRNPQTGDHGFEYLIDMEADGYYFETWTGSEWDDLTNQDLNAGLSDTEMQLTLTLADVGGVTSFDWEAVGARGDDADLAPDTGEAQYPQAAATPPTIKGVVLPRAVFTARAGKTLRIPLLQLMLSDSTVVTVARQTCTLALKGAKLPALAGGCAWKLPKTAKGKRLALKVAYVYNGAPRTWSFTVVPN